jgi:hypothetical protein
VKKSEDKPKAPKEPKKTKKDVKKFDDKKSSK